MQSSSEDLQRTLIHLQNTFLWLHALDKAEILTSLAQSLWEQQQWDLTITNMGQISLFVKSIRKREAHTPQS